MPVEKTFPHSEESPLRAGWRSVRATAGPGAVLVSAAAAIVVAYHHSPPFHAALEQVAAFRVRWGLAYSVVATSLLSGVIPFLYLRLNRVTAGAHPWPHLLFFAVFWGWKGAEVDLFYRLQDTLFGAGTDLATIGSKLLFDQLVYNGCYAAPYGVLVYGWKDGGFRWAEPLADLRRPRWYYRRVLPVMIAVMGVWIPAAACIYALPLALQLPLNSIVNCFWVILFSLLTARGAAAVHR